MRIFGVVLCYRIVRQLLTVTFLVSAVKVVFGAQRDASENLRHPINKGCVR